MTEDQREIVIPPFAISATNRRAIEEDLEMATVYCVSERERKRSLVGKEKEKISFMVRAYYGVWAYPFDQKWILIDSMGLHSFSLTCVEIPPIDEFIQHLRDAHNNRDLFTSMLVRHNDTFAQPRKKTYTISSLIEKPLALTIASYLSDAGYTVNPSPNALILPLEMDEGRMLEVVYELNKARKELEDDMFRLEEGIKTLDEEMSFHMARIGGEIEGINNEYKRQRELTAEIVNRSVEQLRTKKELELKMVLSRFDERKEFFDSQIREYRKLSMHLKRDQEALKRMIETSKPSMKEQKYLDLWSKMLKDISSRMEDIEKEVKSLQSILEALDDERNKELPPLERAYTQLIEAKTKLLSDVEMERELEVKKKREEAEDLSKKGTKLRQQMLSIIDDIKESLEQIEQLPLQEFKDDRPKLVCIPFYLVCYEDKEGRKRYRAHPPSLIQSPTIPLLLKWIPGISSQLLRPYSGQLVDIFEVKLIERLKFDAILEGEVYKRGKRLDILKSHDYKRQISKAIDTLVKQGWVTQRQASGLKKSLEVAPYL